MPKLGTKKHPAIVRVPTQERAEEILATCQAHGWEVIVGIEPGEPEDVTDVEALLNPRKPHRATETVGRNDPCPLWKRKEV